MPDCLCKLCTCGKHKKCVKISASNKPLDSDTEYKERYPAHEPTYRGPAKPPVQTVHNDLPLSTETESRAQYTQKQLSQRVSPSKKEYKPNPHKLESNTGYRSDFQQWELPETRSVKRSVEYQETGPIDTETTNKKDFQAWPLDSRYVHPKAQYKPNPNKLSGESSYNADYPPRQVEIRAQRSPESYSPTTDDRDFKSTMRSEFVGYSGARPIRRKVDYVPNTKPFSGDSTMKQDYHLHGNVSRPPDFKPKTSYIHTTDDRDFKTQNQEQHGVKSMPECRAITALKDSVDLVPSSDGHIYLKPKPEFAQ